MSTATVGTSNLVRRCRQGSNKAWREFVCLYTPLVFALSLRMLRSSAEAEDAAQETFIRVHKYFHTFDPTRAVEPWISSIAYNVCLHRLQRAVRTRTEEARPESLTSPEEAQGASRPEDGAVKSEAAALLREGLTALAAQDRAILHMHYWQGMSTAEVSQATDMPVNTVKVRMFRARSKLREVLGPMLKEDPQWI
jgi:RNA polymerase sigma factor (sigma-70 family)